MIPHIAIYLTDLLIENGKVDQTKKEIYEYGFEMGILYIINILTALGISIILKMPVEGLFFLFSFMSLRTYTGGYHASSHLTCYIISVTIMVIVLIAGKHIIATGLNYLGIILAIVGVLLMFLLAPVDDKNKRMDEVEKVVFRKRGMRNMLIWIVITVSLYFTRFQNISIILCLCLFMMGLAVIIGLLKNHIIDMKEQ